MKSLSDKAGFLILANLIKYSIGFVLPMVLVRMLSQTDYGTYQQLILVATAATGIMTLGLPTSVYYFYHHVALQVRATLIVQTTLLVTAGGLIAGAFVFLGARTLSGFLGNPSMAGLLAISAIALPFTIASEHCMSFVISQNRFQMAVFFETVETVLRLFLVLAPLRLGYGLTGVITCMVMFSIVRWAGRNAYLFFASGVTFSGWSKSTFVRDQLDYSVPVAMVSVASLIGTTFNKGIIAAAFSPAQYAIYAVGNFPIPLATIFQASVADVLRSSLPPLVRDGNLEEVVRLVREATRKLSLIVLPSFVFLFGFSRQLITLLFTDRYHDSVDIFRIFILTVPLDMMILSAIPQVFGRTRLNFYINLISMVVLVVSSYVLLKTVGFYGAAIAAVASRYFSTMLFLILALKLTRSTLRQFFAWRHMLRTLLSSAVALFVAHGVVKLTGSNLLNLLLAGTVYSVGFLFVAWRAGALTQGDVSLMVRWAERFRPGRASR
jgi:O-antigen/teichoic acid export membrane protein